jgi:hypothetical protein
MFRKTLIMTLAIICSAAVMLSAQQNHYRKAEIGLRQAYEKITGVSLKEAIDQLILEERKGLIANGNVIVRFNGGSAKNRLFIGRQNTLEILVTNDYYVQAASLGFEFSCTGGPGSFSWVNGYGTLPGGSDLYVKEHYDAFDTPYYWEPNAYIHSNPDQILLGGVAFYSSDYMQPGSTPRLLYSMQIELPDDFNLVGQTFYVDNVRIPPAGDWFFQEAPPLTLPYPPDF